MIKMYLSNDDTLDEDGHRWKLSLVNYIFDDEQELLPVPVMTNVNPGLLQC